MENFDLIIIGTGSGNSIIGPDFDDWNIALVERGVFGGTCLNRGCIPSKMFVYAADIAQHIAHASTYQIDATMNGVDWPAIVDRVFGRIDPIAEGGREYRHENPNVTVFEATARFTGPGMLSVGTEDESRLITAPNIVLGAGARPHLPNVAGIEDVGIYTSDTIMRLRELPKRLAVIGGGYIGAELGHVFGSLGSEVTIVLRSDAMLREQDREVSVRFTEEFSRHHTVLKLTDLVSFRREGAETLIDVVTTEADGSRREHTIAADAVLVATGRTANGDELNVSAADIETSDDGTQVVVDEHMRTNIEGVWAFGDLSNEYQLKHVANAEVKVLTHNLLHPDDLRTMDYHAVPAAVFSSPQIATVGLDEALAERRKAETGDDYLVARKDFGATAYGWAMEDSTSFVKLIACAETRLLLGAHIMGPQASTLIQQLIQGMRFGQTVDEMATGQMYIHPALTEAVENALLEL